jgi:hypothetical protein
MHTATPTPWYASAAVTGCWPARQYMRPMPWYASVQRLIIDVDDDGSDGSRRDGAPLRDHRRICRIWGVTADDT